MYYDDAARATQEASDAALARRLAMLPPGEELLPGALQESADAALAQQLASFPTASSLSSPTNVMYQPEWGERPVSNAIIDKVQTSGPSALLGKFDNKRGCVA